MKLIFRKLRVKSLNEGNITKYMKYAIGEILIVMIGILLALQLNNWNETRKLKRTESVYLKRFQSEIQLDIQYFSNEIQKYKTRNKIIEDFSVALDNENSQDSTVMNLASKFFREGWIMAMFSPSTSTFDDLSSTGNLNVISNTNLRDEIVELYQQFNEVQDGFKVNHDWITPIDALITSEYSGLKYDSLTAFLYPSQSYNERVNELRKDREIYIRNASNHYWSNKSSINRFTILKEQCAGLLNKIDIELK